MKIALISDSHGALDRLEEVLHNFDTAGIREIVHAGDFALGEIVELLSNFPQLSFRIARGNCDVDTEKILAIANLPNVELEEILEFELGGRRIAVAHRIRDLANSDAPILISGHTHIPSAKAVNGKLFLNPGSLMDDGGYFILDLANLIVERKLFSDKALA
ncbi:MAG: metallophosphoesterase family protein [Patescibacteria group bacterium]